MSQPSQHRMRFEDAATAIFVLLHDAGNKRPSIFDMINEVRHASGSTLRESLDVLRHVLTRDLDYRTDPKVADALRRLASPPSARTSLPPDFPIPAEAEEQDAEQTPQKETP
jgi:hypothetical protein